MKQLSTITMVAIVAVVLTTVLCTGSAQAQGWPEVFEPNQLITLNLTIDPCDWAAIVREESPTLDPKTFTEYPAVFWADGEPNMIISVRQKSTTRIPLAGYTIPGDSNLIDPNKVKISLKLDINEYNSSQTWHDMKKLSLENGSNGGVSNVIAEGIAANLHTLASGPEGYNYDAWRSNWVKLYVNGTYYGVYVSNEQHDKQFLIHRGLYTYHQTWMYKSWGSGALQLKVGDDLNPLSPTYQALCYRPFPALDPGSPLYVGTCSTPNDVNVANDMNSLVNMRGMLALGAVNTLMDNHDDLFGANGHNFSFEDFDDGSGRKRMFFPWDVDSALALGALDYDIYQEGGAITTYAGIILGHPTFRSLYNQIYKDLLNGPLSFADVNEFLNEIEPVLTDAVAADPWNLLPSPGDATKVAEYFDQIRSWYPQRIPNVLARIDFDEPEPVGIILLDDGFDKYLEGQDWDTNWNDAGHSWQEDTDEHGHGRPSIWATNGSEGDLICDDLDADNVEAIHVGFKFRKKGTETTDFTLYYYNGSVWSTPIELDTLGGDNEWLYFSDTITDSQYFVSDFKIKFNANLGGGEDVWIDDVLITKETVCTKANLDSVDPVNLKDFLILALDWRETGPGLAGDITGNEVLDEEDLEWIAQQWLGDCGQP